MKLWKQSGKRAVAMLLALAMVLSFAQTGLAVTAHAAQNSQSASAGALVANAYGAELKEWEKSILRSGYLKGNTFTYQAPSENNSDGLVSVDADAKTVTVKSYRDAQGNSWTCGDTARIVANGQTVEEVSLSGGKGTFAYTGNAYAVAVTYTLTAQVDTSVQKDLLNAPYWIAKGVNNLDVLKSTDVNSGLGMLTDHRNILNTIANGYSLGNGGSITFDAAPQAKDLLAQMDRNKERLDVQVALDSYPGTSGKVSFLLSNGAAVKTYAKTAYTDILAIHAQLKNDLFKSMVTAGGVTTEAQYDMAVKIISSLVENMKHAAEDDWTLLDNKGVLKTGMTEADYLALDALATAASVNDYTLAEGETGPHNDVTLTGTLTLASADVTCNMNRYVVTAYVYADVIDTDTLDSTATKRLTAGPVSLTFGDGTTGAEIGEALRENGLEQKALNDWAAYGVDTENYARETSLSLMGFELHEDTTYTITYTPKTLTVTYGKGFEDASGLPTSVPYGYQLTLPEYEGTDLVYDYTVNKTGAADQGSVLRIVEDTELTRELNKAWEDHDIGALVAKNYAADNAAVTEMLTSPALSTGSIRLRTPTDSNNLLTLSETASGYTVTAKTYRANTGSLVWVPASGKLVGGSQDGKTVTFTKQGDVYTADLTDGFDRVTVSYKLELDWASLGKTQQETLDILNLPYVLTREATRQMGAMKSLLDQQGNLNSVNGRLNSIYSLVKNDDQYLSQESKDAMTAVMEQGYNNAAKSLYLLTYLSEYQAQATDADKLSYYYRNYKALDGQMDLLYSKLMILIKDPNFDAFIEYYAPEDKDKIAKIDEIVAKLEGILQDMLEPNAALNLNSTSLKSLAASVTANLGKLAAFTGPLSQPVLTTELHVDAPNKVTISLSLTVDSSDGDAIASSKRSLTLSAGENGTATLTAADAAGLTALLAEMKTEAGLDEAHYLLSSGELPKAGTVVSGNAKYDFLYVPKTYAWSIVDENGTAVSNGTVPYDSAYVDLPESTESGIRYEYTLNGTKLNGTGYTFTTEELDGGKTTIVRTRVDVQRQQILDLIDQLNQNFYDNGLTFTSEGKQYLIAAFVPVEQADGTLSLVLRLSPRRAQLEKALAESVGNTILNSGLEYIGLMDKAMLSGGKISLQAVIDALLETGVGLHSVADAVNEDGTIRESDLEGNVLSISTSRYMKDTGLLGGMLATLSMQLGSSAENARNVQLYVTLEDFGLSTESLKKAYSAIDKVRTNYLDATAENGVLDVEVKLTDRQYQAVLTALLALGETRLNDLSSIDATSVAQIVYDLIAPVIQDERVTSTTLINTLKSLKVNTDSLDLSFYDKAAPVLRNLLTNGSAENQTSTGDVYSLTLGYALSKVLDDLGLSDGVKSMIVESESGLKLPVRMKIDNLNRSYQAVVLDPKASGVNKLWFYSDAASLQTALDNRASASLVVLLSDLDGNLHIQNHGTVLDLNGHTVSGDLTADSRTIVVNGDLTAVGGINGTVSGKAELTAGRYASDVTAFLFEGYHQEADGTVANDFYTLTQDAQGNYVATIRAESILALEKMPSVQTLAVDLLYSLALNQYQAASLSIGGNAIYEADVADLRDLLDGISTADGNALLACIKTDGITAFANDLLAKITDFAALAENGTVATYDFTTAPWRVNVAKADGEDRLALSVGTGNTTNRTLTIAIEENDAVKALLTELGKISEQMDVTVSLDPIVAAGKTISTSGSVEANIIFDMSGNKDYAMVIGILTAAQLTGDRQTELLNAVKSCVVSGSTQELQAALEKATLAELIAGVKATKRDTFEELVNTLGIENVDTAKALEDVYDDFLYLVGRAFAKLNINGGSRTLVSFATGDYGSYGGAKQYQKTFNKGVSDFTLTLNADAKVSVTLRLFKEKDDAVQVFDANHELVYSGDSLADGFDKAQDGYTVDVRDNVTLERDVTVTGSITVTGAEKIDLNGKTIILADKDSSVTADADLGESSFVSFSEDYVVKTTETDGKFVYSLVEKVWPVIVTLNGEVLYKGDDLAAAFAAAKDGSTITVHENLTLNDNVTVTGSITVTGAEKIDLNGKTIILADKDSSVTADADLGESSFVSFSEDYVVKTTETDGKFVYSLVEKVWPVIVTLNDEVLYKGNDLTAAFAAAKDGSTITINESLTLDSNVVVKDNITIVNTANLGQNGKQILLSKGGSITTDGELNVTTVEPYMEVVRQGNTYVLEALMPELTGAAVTKSDSVAGGKVDGDYIILDVDPNGINESILKASLRFFADNAEWVKVTSVTGLVSGRVANGAKVTVEAGNSASDRKATKTYTIIILGDVNGNGRTDSGDSTLMDSSYLGRTTLSDIQKMAADMNRNGRIESGDSAKNATKYTYMWAKGLYKSALQ